MASSSFDTFQVNHDIFLSFRGKDTRNNFTSHFRAALYRSGINVFIDEKLNGGDEILCLMNVIQGSKISVIIFSEDFASSTWCLEELAKIVECKKEYGQIVIPIFYHVDPSAVRHQTGNFGEAFTNHEEHFKDKMHIWRTALKEAANLSGWHFDGTKSESILMEKIVEDILKRLNDMFTNDYKHLVGVESMIKEIESLFWSGIDDVCTIGIWGIGGIGKTTIASAVYNKISSQFESSYFIQNVREQSEIPNGLTRLRGELLSTILEDNNVCKGTPNMGNPFILNRLHNKVFIVFDDVISFQQIEVLIGDLKCLGFGSRIIITTRDKHVLENCEVDDIFPVVGLSNNHALQLFCQCAFKQENPLIDYKELSNRAVRCAKGVPLALKVLGLHLYKSQRQCWESALDELEESPHMHIETVLKISYDGLTYKEKDSFLNIACFFQGWNEYVVKEILDSCGLHAEDKIRVLRDRAFITITNNIIIMHDLLQAMGRDIVKQESVYEPEKRSRLWHHSDIYHVLTNNLGTKKIRGLCLDMSIIREIHLNPHAFSNMHNLKLLIVYNSNKMSNKVHGFRCLESNFRELRHLCWREYPERSLPSKIHPECLVVLKMLHSNLEQLWTGVENLANLKCIDLSFSSHLLKIPDLSHAPNLERLILEDCKSLLEITPPSIQNVNSLVTLNLRNCKSLVRLPIGIQSKSLRFIILSGCSNLMMAPRITCNIEQLCLDGTAIEEFSSSIEYPPKLVDLNLENCSKLKCLPNNFCELKSLRHLVLRGCSNLKTISKLPCEIEELDLEGTAIKELLPSIKLLSNLFNLRLTNCSKLESLPKGFYELKSLKYLFLSGCSNLKTIPELSFKIEELYLDETAIKELVPSSIEYRSSLVRLSLRNCSSLESLPDGICKLKSLKYLDISGCSKLDRLPEDFANLQSLEVLEADEIPVKDVSSVSFLTKLGSLSFKKCKSLELVGLLLPGLQFLWSLNLSHCNITELPHNLGLLSLLEKLKLVGNNFESIPTSIIKLSKLWLLDLSYCNKLQFLPELPCNIKSLVAHSCTSLQALPCLPNPAARRASFINCLNLGSNSSSDEAVSLTTLLSADMRDDLSYLRSYISFPGNEIPKWFSFQSNGFLIELPQGSLNNIIGFAFCIILEFQDYHYNNQELVVKYELCLGELDQEEKSLRYLWPQPCEGFFWAWEKGSGPNYIESDHVCLGYEFHDFKCNAKTVMIFHVTNDFRSFMPSEYCKIKQCGVHFFSKHELISSDDEENHKEFMSRTLEIRNSINGKSNSRMRKRCGVPLVNEKEVEVNESSFALSDLNELPQDFLGSTVDEISMTTQSPTNNDGAESSGSGCCDDEVEPQPKRLKESRFF